MKKRKKILIALILIPILTAILLVSVYLILNIQGVIQSFERGNAFANNKILIASQGSEFKSKLVNELIRQIYDEDTFIRVIDIRELETQNNEDWNACILVHTMEIHKPPRMVDEFLSRSSDLSNTICVRTSGGGDETKKDHNVDAISSASRSSAITPITELIISKLNKIAASNYPDENLPESIPQIFAPEVVSKGYAEFGISFMPDMSEIYFTRRGEGPNPRIGKIMQMKKIDGLWTEPEIAPFSGVYNDMEPLITPDGQKIIFGSNRPIKTGGAPTGFLQWYADKTPEGWSEPKILGTPFVDRFVMYPTLANNGNLYFTGEDGIYVSEMIDSDYQTPVKLGDEINALPRAAHPYISPDEKLLIFDAQPRGALKSDLFISWKNDDGSWTEALKFSEQINSAETQAIAMISPDDKFLFFVRNGEIFWVQKNSIAELDEKVN
jgi:hypothetical protein